MSTMKRGRRLATVIGDVVGSRRAADRRAVHRSIVTVLERVNAELSPVRPVTLANGDEYACSSDRDEHANSADSHKYARSTNGYSNE